MRLDLYQAETARIAAAQSSLLDQAIAILESGRALTSLEQSGVLHALQILIENAIGKGKQLLKAQGQPVPISAYDTFKALGDIGTIDPSDLAMWNAVIGLRNRIVHDYMNIDMTQVLALIEAKRHVFVAQFLLRPVS